MEVPRCEKMEGLRTFNLGGVVDRCLRPATHQLYHETNRYMVSLCDKHFRKWLADHPSESPAARA